MTDTARLSGPASPSGRINPKNSGKAKNFVRGGQVIMHYLHMGKQVFYTAGIAAFVAAVLCFLCLNYLTTAYYDWYLAFKYAVSDTVFTFGRGQNADQMYVLTMPDGSQKSVPLAEFTNNPAIKAHYETMVRWAIITGLISIIPGLGLSFLVVWFFNRTGERLDDVELQRGSVLVPPEQLKKIIDRKWDDWRVSRGKKVEDEYRYALAGIDFPPEAPMVHTQMVGTTGVGKTVAIMELLDQIRANGDKVVLYDRMGAFTRLFYDEETDYILNPFDARDAGWSPFADADSAPGFAAMAEAMIPNANGQNDPFWTNAARSVFQSAAEELAGSGEAAIEDLSRLILKSDLDELGSRLKGTTGGTMLDLNSPKTAQSVRTNVVQPLDFLRYLKNSANPFSIGDWVRNEDEKGFLFLSGQVQYAAATRNLISAAIEIAANATMTCPPTDRPRIWFFIDELPSLNYLPCLDTSLAEIRQFGGCFVIGYQVFAKLRNVYGDRIAEAISGTVNNSVYFDTPDKPTAQRCSEALGMEDITETSEGMSIGANETRDGVTFNQKRIERAIVTPSQIMDLPPLAAYLRYAYDSPRARVTFTHTKREPVAEAFVAPTPDAKRQVARQRGLPAPKAFQSPSPSSTVHDEDGIVIDHDGSHTPMRDSDQYSDPDFIADLPAPDKSVKGEECFLKEAELWVERLKGPVSTTTGKHRREFDEGPVRVLMDVFIIHRLRGGSIDDAKEPGPDVIFDNDEDRQRHRLILADGAQRLLAFREREKGREKDREEQAVRRAALDAAREQRRKDSEAKARETRGQVETPDTELGAQPKRSTSPPKEDPISFADYF